MIVADTENGPSYQGAVSNSEERIQKKEIYVIKQIVDLITIVTVF